MNIYEIIGRNNNIIEKDINDYSNILKEEVVNSSFLVIGGAGSIGQAVVKEIFKREPKKIHVVDISENNLVELVRDLRSSFGYLRGDFQTYAIDCGSLEFELYCSQQEQFDYILNLSALKHVRSEKDPYTLMRMIDVNIINTIKTIKLAIEMKAKKYFCVSTDKAANPVSMMGASKRIMEYFLLQYSDNIKISTARFANVAFSDGSLPLGFTKRIEKDQPLSAPNDVKRYFVTSQEAGQLCLMSTLLGKTREIFFPKLDADLHLLTFSDIAIKYLKSNNFEPYLCKSEDEAREKVQELKDQGKWPCFFSASDTTGEKNYEEFYMENEEVDFNRYSSLGIVINNASDYTSYLNDFLKNIEKMKLNKRWDKADLVNEFKKIIPEFMHEEKNKNLDGKM